MTCDKCERVFNYCFYIADELWAKAVGRREGHICAHCVLEQIGGLDWLIIWNEAAEKMRTNYASVKVQEDEGELESLSIEKPKE